MFCQNPLQYSSVGIQWDIGMRFWSQWRSHISRIWDLTPSSRMTTLTPTEVGSSQSLQNLGVERMEWPAVSPDLNPIEYLWDQLGRAVRVRVTNATMLADLRQILVEEWVAIPQQCVTRLETSMRKRCQAVVAAYGSSTHYWGPWQCKINKV